MFLNKMRIIRITSHFVFVPHHFTHRGSACQGGSSIHLCYLRLSIKAGPSCREAPTTAHFPHCRSKGLREAESLARPMREQRRLEPTNQRPASWDAPAELAARHHFEKERPRLPPLDGGAGELPGGHDHHPHLRPPKAGFQLLLNASSPAALSKDLSGLQKVSQLNFAFCSSFWLPSTALQRPQRNFVGLLRSFSGLLGTGGQVLEGFYH